MRNYNYTTYIIPFILLSVLFGCNGIFDPEPEMDLIYHIENNSNHSIKMVRYSTFTDSSTAIDSVVISEGELLIEDWKTDPFNDGFKYLGYDSIQVYYGDSLVINHYKLGLSPNALNRPIYDNFNWELFHTAKSGNYLTIHYI